MSFECSNCNTDFGVSMMGSLGSWKSDECSPFVEFECLCRKCLKYKLDEIIKDYDIPNEKSNDYVWLSENIALKNSAKTNFNQAKFYLSAIIRKML